MSPVRLKTSKDLNATQWRFGLYEPPGAPCPGHSHYLLYAHRLLSTSKS